MDPFAGREDLPGEQGWRAPMPMPLRPAIRFCLEGMFFLGAVAIASSGESWLLAIAIAVGAIAMEVSARRQLSTLELVGSTVTVLAENGRSVRFDVSDIARIRVAFPTRGSKFVLRDGRRVPIVASGALAPIVRSIHRQRPDLGDRLLHAIEKMERAEERRAARRDRNPWIRRLCLGLAPVWLLILTGWLAWTVHDRNEIIGRSEATTATVVEAGDVDRQGRSWIEIEYSYDGTELDGVVRATGSPTAGDELVVWVDPLDPAQVWASDLPVPDLPLWPLLLGSIITCTWALLLPIAFAEHPRPEPIDPQARQPAR